MNPIAKNILAVVAGFVVGCVVNMSLVQLGMVIIPLPDGVDGNDMEALKQAIKEFGPTHFLFPFLAHAFGTLIGALVAAKLTASHPMRFAIGIGFAFLAGGIAMVALVGGPLWFIVCDLGLAYIPMAILGGTLAGASKSEDTPDRTDKDQSNNG